MIRTIQYRADADNSRVLVALDLKAAIPKCVSQSNAEQYRANRCGSCSCLLHVVHRHHGTQNALRLCLHQNQCQQRVWIRVVLCQRVDSQLSLTLYFDQSWRRFAHITIQALNSSPTWTTGICGSNHSTYYRQLLSSLQPPDQSSLLYSPPRHKYGKALARTPFHLSFKTRSHSHSAVLGGHLHIHGDTEPSPVILGEQTTMEKTTQRFQKIATTLADLNAKGLNVQTVNDLLTMYVGAASQHVLRI